MTTKSKILLDFISYFTNQYALKSIILFENFRLCRRTLNSKNHKGIRSIWFYYSKSIRNTVN